MNQFIKKNHSKHSKALIIEAEGLMTLRQAIMNCQSTIKIPTVHHVNEQQMCLTKVNSTAASVGQYQQLGHELARLHAIKYTNCGYETDNFIGLNPQKNKLTENWGAFFYQYRLMFQAELIVDIQISKKFINDLAAIRANLISWLNQNCNHFSLLHGDLWSGNVLFDQEHLWLIDPAVYYGDADVDIAMTELFGGFPNAFYKAYAKGKPLSDNYALKKVIYNLYHQLNHYNIFGPSYLSSCQQAMKILKNQFG